jgi:hypothetical protein
VFLSTSPYDSNSYWLILLALGRGERRFVALLVWFFALGRLFILGHFLQRLWSLSAFNAIFAFGPSAEGQSGRKRNGRYVDLKLNVSLPLYGIRVVCQVLDWQQHILLLMGRCF